MVYKIQIDGEFHVRAGGQMEAQEIAADLCICLVQMGQLVMQSEAFDCIPSGSLFVRRVEVEQGGEPMARGRGCGRRRARLGLLCGLADAPD